MESHSEAGSEADSEAHAEAHREQTPDHSSRIPEADREKETQRGIEIYTIYEIPEQFACSARTRNFGLQVCLVLNLVPCDKSA